MDCLAGQSSTAGATVCQQCEPGYWSKKGSLCTACIAGKKRADEEKGYVIILLVGMYVVLSNLILEFSQNFKLKKI